MACGPHCHHGLPPVVPQGVLVYLGSQCTVGHLDPHLYKSGSAALKLGVESGHSQMTSEAAVVKVGGAVQCERAGKRYAGGSTTGGMRRGCLSLCPLPRSTTRR